MAYRRMGSMEEHLGGNAISVASLRYQFRDVWRSPRDTVLRIEALALVAITLSFFLAFFGSCRRWSNRWIVQKGFLVAQVLSLSLGTYSIGLMQSSQVKSDMYPIWAVSLLTLFGCVDPVTAYIGLDYKGPLSKMIFQLCLYFGYVMMMGLSTISSDVGKLAIGVLSAITFIKGFHRSMAFVLPGETREDVVMQRWIQATEPAALAGDGKRLKVHLHLYLSRDINESDIATMADIHELSLPEGTAAANSMTIKDVCLSYSFSHLLRRRFLGLSSRREMEEKLVALETLVRDCQLSGTIDYKRALKVVEVELAFLFEAFFTSNEFLHFYQAKTCSFWALASFIGICFVGVVAAIIPGSTMASSATTADLIIAETKTADLIITLVILVSLALLQLVQLVRCWTSNWARVGIACEYTIKAKKKTRQQIISQWVMGLRLFLVGRVNWFDKYLWQDRLGQDSIAAVVQRGMTQMRREFVFEKVFCCCGHCPWISLWLSRVGVDYFYRVVAALLLSDTTNPGGTVRLHDDVKASIAEFLGNQITSRKIGVQWSSLFLENGLQDWLEYLPYTNTIARVPFWEYDNESEAYAFTRRVMIWHIATWYCEEAEKAAGDSSSSSSSSREKNRRVAMDLSKYCVYLVVSAPELLPGSAAEIKKAFDMAMRETEYDALFVDKPLEAMQQMTLSSENDGTFEFVAGVCVYLGKRLRNEAMTTPPKHPEQQGRRPCSSDHWELLALVWVQTLLYAAPYGDVQAHMQRLAQGGEFITHLWALLYHLGIDKWEVAGIDELKGESSA